MMAKRKISLEDVLNEYLASEPKPSYEALEKWSKRFPEHKEELVEFTVSWSKLENAPKSDAQDSFDEETLLLKAMSIVGDRIHTMRTAKKIAKSSLTNLSTEAKNKGLGLKELAKLTDLSVPIISKIMRGFLDPLSIPKLVIERLAAVLDLAAEEIALSIQNASMTSQGIKHKSKKKPEFPKDKENFFNAVRNDRELSENQRIFWLEFEKNIQT